MTFFLFFGVGTSLTDFLLDNAGKVSSANTIEAPPILPWPKSERRKDRKHSCVVAILLPLLRTDGELVPFPGQDAKRVSPLFERLISELLELFTHKSSPLIGTSIKGCGGAAVLLLPRGEATKQLSPIWMTAPREASGPSCVSPRANCFACQLSPGHTQHLQPPAGILPLTSFRNQKFSCVAFHPPRLA